MIDYKLMNNIDNIFNKNNDVEVFSKGYIGYLISVLQDIPTKQIKNFVDVLLKARKNRARGELHYKAKNKCYAFKFLFKASPLSIKYPIKAFYGLFR